MVMAVKVLGCSLPPAERHFSLLRSSPFEGEAEKPGANPHSSASDRAGDDSAHGDVPSAVAPSVDSVSDEPYRESGERKKQRSRHLRSGNGRVEARCDLNEVGLVLVVVLLERREPVQGVDAEDVTSVPPAEISGWNVAM